MQEDEMPHTTAYTGTADIHMHTTASDGFAPVDVVLDYVMQHTTLDVVAITDHDEIDASLWAYRNRDRYTFDIVPGLEVSSRDGHVLALWITQSVAPGMSLADTVHAIHDLGGLAVLAHPYDYFIHPVATWRNLTRPHLIPAAEVDAIEVHNGGAVVPFANTIARRSAHSLGLSVVSNSDAHSPLAIGAGITRFKGRTAQDLRQAITCGDTIAVYGRRWPLVDYIKLFPAAVLDRLPVFGAKAPAPASSLGQD
jgi:predicted metal-dependent phosphoesterase TrpH